MERTYQTRRNSRIVRRLVLMHQKIQIYFKNADVSEFILPVKTKPY